jgi:hypothetical protein
MIKYTILYKNGKAWSGKAEKVEDIPIVSCTALFFKQTNITKVYIPSAGYGLRRWSYRFNLGGNEPRKPNPASITKKQKAFDKAYARWIEMQADLNQGRRLDISIKAYKKWLWEQKQAELKSVDVAKSITFSEPVEVPVNITINWDGIYKPWKEAAIKKYKTHSYDTPIKTTYTFWLGAFGEISDE